MVLKTLIIKDLKIVLSDKKAFILLVAMPIILFSILSFALAGSFDDGDDSVWTINIGIIKEYDFDEDYESVSEYLSKDELVELEDIVFTVLDDLDFITYEFYSYEEATSLIDANELHSAVILPEGYLADLSVNMSPSFRQPIEIEVIKNVDTSYSSSIVLEIFNSIGDQLSQVMITNKVIHETLNTYDVPEMVKEQVLTMMEEKRDSAELVSVNVEEFKIDKLKSINSAQYYSVAMMAMFLLFGASYGAKFMLVERKKFTLQRQTMAGLSATKIVLGKMVIIFCIALMQIGLMFLTSSLGFGVYWGSPLKVLFVTLLTAFAVTGFGALLSALAMQMDSLSALNMLESGIFQVIALFGGSYFPIFQMPKWFQAVSKTLLNGAALDAYHKVMMEAPIQEMIPGLASLIVNGLLFMTIGILIIKAQTSKTANIQREVA